MAQSFPTLIPGLRSPFDQVKGLPAKRLAISGENDIESVRKLIGV